MVKEFNRVSRGGRGGFRGGRGGRGGFGGGRGRGGFGGGRGRGGFGGGRGRGGGRGFGGGRGRGRGGGRGRGRGGFRGGAKVVVKPYIHKGVYIMQDKNDAILTKSLAPGESVYGEKRVTVEENNQKIEYRVWNPYRSKIGAFIVAGVNILGFAPGSKVLYLGAASGTTCSHVADVIGEEGVIYGVEFSARCGRDLIAMAKKRTNVVPIIEDARKPWNYRFIVEMVDFVFADVAQPDQARIIALNCKHYLKNGGVFMIAIKASCIDSTQPPKVVFQGEIDKLKKLGLTPKKFITLDPYQKDHCMIVGYFRPNTNQK